MIFGDQKSVIFFKNKKTYIYLVLILFIFFHSLPFYFGVKPPAAFSQDSGPPGIDITVQDVERIITGFACWLTRVVLAIMIIFLIVSGIQFLFAQGNPERIERAKRSLIWTLVGIAVILATNIIIATIANALGGDYSFIPLKC